MKSKAKIWTLLSAMFFLVALLLFLFVGWPAIQSSAFQTTAAPTPSTGKGGGTGPVGANTPPKANDLDEPFRCILPDPEEFKSSDEVEKMERDHTYWLRHYQGDLVDGEIVRPPDLYPVDQEGDKIEEPGIANKVLYEGF